MDLLKKIISIIISVFFIFIYFSVDTFGFNVYEIKAANELAKAGYINNHSNNIVAYKLNQKVLRQEIALVSRRISGINENINCKNVFADVTALKPNTWVCKNVEALVENNLISKNKFFNPEKNISKSEALIMFIKATGYKGFKINDLNNWQKEVVDFAVSNKIVKSFTDYNSFATRGFVFEIAYNAINENQNKDDENQKKDHIIGLVAMGKPLDILNGGDPLKELNFHPRIYKGVVINTFWKNLEKEKGKYDFSSIENTLSKIIEYNKKYSENKITGKIRIFAGNFSPLYVKKINGGPIVVYPNKGPSVEIPLFWTKEYGDRFAELIKQLAFKYDNNPLISEITVNTASSLTAEPFIAPLNKKSKQVLHDHGFSDLLYKKALRRALEDYKVWEKTYVDYSFNSFNSSDGNSNKIDPNFTIELMKDFKKLYKENAIISNHGLKNPLSKSASMIYPTIKELGGDISFQTYGPKVNFDSSLELGFEYGMTQFEMWQTKETGGYADISLEELKKFNSLFNDN